MMLQQFQVLAAYQRQMNQQFYTVCEQLGEEELRQDRGAYFKSIFGTLNHMLLTDRLWLSGFLGNPISFSSLFEELYDNFAEQRSGREQTDADIKVWVEGLTVKSLQVPFSDGLQLPLWVTITHFFNHQTHHRGQLSTLLSQAGLNFGATDLPWIEGVRAHVTAGPS
ncbi:MAG TPA: DinB family protein [Gammaproteobacteria bacterium]|jgi:uncharacterized damage-inducible protein DinB|nr:damage-inducible protein DinB [Chromatiales bacterium]MCP4926278.1 damage-inducible protein DinB [Gammaproteobacteria bacterium]MDP7154090.1 DinB family protein [Gammaproteobacteria bacterium]MDP7296830.1 DinB family protein [Gammaproteobacteria bacterium]HJP38384.1 DinB family protein [Gammaproteobacteria bacterium]